MQGPNESQVKAFFRNKWVRIFLVVDLVAIIVIVGVMIWNNTKNVALSINVAPIDATVQIGGEIYNNNSTYKLHPGSYDVVISREGFEAKSFVVDLEPNHSVDLATFLKENFDDGEMNFEFYQRKENFMSYSELAEIASKNNNRTYDNDTSAEEFIEVFQKNYDLMNRELPIEIYDFQDDPNASPRYKTIRDINISATGASDCQKTLCIKIITRITDDDQYVNNYLKEKGFDLEMFEVQNAEQF